MSSWVISTHGFLKSILKGISKIAFKNFYIFDLTNI